MIPRFPQFKILELSDKEDIEKCTLAFPPYAEYQFATMWCWEIHKPFQLSVIKGNLLLKQTNCLTGEYFFSLIGLNNLSQTIKEVLSFLSHHKLPPVLRCIPEEMTTHPDLSQFRITEDRDNFDYIFDVAELFRAKGNKYKAYRHKASAFIINHPCIVTRQVDLANSRIKDEIISLFETWSTNKQKSNKNIAPAVEFKALYNLLTSVHEFDSIIAFGVFDRDKMIGFSINDINHSHYMTGLFWKANTDYKGIYQYLMKQIVMFSLDRGISYLNWESDLGIASLRRSKSDLQPAFFLKKYNVENPTP